MTINVPVPAADLQYWLNYIQSQDAAAGVPPVSGFGYSPRGVHSGDQPPLVSTDGTDSTPVITEVYITLVKVRINMSITGLSVFQGSVSSGNLKVGLADSNGNVVATSVSTAASGTDSYQRVPFTSVYNALGPADYFGLMIWDNTTARFNAHTFGDFGGSKQTGQVYATGFTTITPPTTFVAANKPFMFDLY